MVNKYYYEILRVWYLASWIELCPECGEFSEKVTCPKCGAVKEVTEKEVTDIPTVKVLELFSREKTQELEKKLNEKQSR